MSDEHKANVDGINMTVFLRKNTTPAKGKKIVFRKIFIGSPWIKAEVLDLPGGRITMKTCSV
jgi:hypothetical protein